MNYPSGQVISIGDIVWWNEGTATGVVVDVLESPSEIENWDVESPGIFICCDREQTILTRDVFISESVFADEAIEKIAS